MPPVPMEIDLPPSGALTPDASAARSRSVRAGLTLTLALDAEPVDAGRQLPGGTVVAPSPHAAGSESLRVAIDSRAATAETITF